MLLQQWVILFLPCFALALSLETGVQYNYDFVTNVEADEDCSPSRAAVSHQLRALVRLTPVWRNPMKEEEKLVKIELSNLLLLVAKKGTYEKQASKVGRIQQASSYILFKENQVVKLFETEKEHLDMKNLKRGIVSLIQSQNTNEVVTHSDVAGDCQVLYKINGRTTRKVRANCIHALQDESLVQSDATRSGTIFQTSTSSCEREDDSTAKLLRCSSKDNVKVLSNIWRKPSLCITSSSHLEFKNKANSEKESVTANTLQSALAALQSAHKEPLLEASIHVMFNKKEDKKNSKGIISLITGYQDNLRTSNLAKLKSASVFLKLLPEFRAASQEDVTAVLKNKKFKLIMPQIVDLVAACGSENSVKAAFETLDFLKGDSDLVERFLVGLSLSPRTSSTALKELLAIASNPQISDEVKATVLTTMGRLLRTYSQQLGRRDRKVREDCLSYLTDSVPGCADDACKLRLLRALRNAADASTAPLLLEWALKGGKPALEAVRGLREIFRSHQLTGEFEEGLRSVFNQFKKKQDRSTRSVVAEILLRGHTSNEVVKDILSSLSDQSDPEFATFLASKIAEAIEKDQSLKKKVSKLLLEKDLGHYNSLSQRGASSLFSRQLAAASGINVSYTTEMEMLAGGLLKRSSFDVDVSGTAGPFNLLSVGLFGEGLSSLAGESTEEEGVDPMAGMELTVLGVALRPYTLFSGSSQAISHVWSGTASEPTPALQGNILVTDDSRALVLSNGLPLRVRLATTLSLDLTGAIQVSLWNRNAQTQVKTSGALLGTAWAETESDWAVTRADFSFSGQANLNFNSDLEFYEEPFKMCVRMDQPQFVIKRDIQRSVTVPGSKFLVRRKTKRKSAIPAHSYALNRKNDEQCQQMLS